MDAGHRNLARLPSELRCPSVRPESSVGIFLTCDVIVFPFFSVFRRRNGQEGAKAKAAGRDAVHYSHLPDGHTTNKGTFIFYPPSHFWSTTCLINRPFCASLLSFRFSGQSPCAPSSTVKYRV